MAHVNSHPEDKYRDAQLDKHLHKQTNRRDRIEHREHKEIEKGAGEWVGDKNGFEVWEEK